LGSVLLAAIAAANAAGPVPIIAISIVKVIHLHLVAFKCHSRKRKLYRFYPKSSQDWGNFLR